MKVTTHNLIAASGSHSMPRYLHGTRANLLAGRGEAGAMREYLMDVVGQERRRLAAMERIKSLLDHPAVHLGQPRPSRYELHKR